MFDSILIANRGEIACRIIRTARSMGIKTIAVYSEADRDALHVDMASDAMLIGPPPALQSYLNVDAIMLAIEEMGAQAVHPGYGFLSENASFAERLADEGVTFIGPPPEAIRTLGDKITSKRLAQQAGVPTVPGSADPVSQPDEAARIADEIGYPVMLKASAGGGGKGMRAVTGADELQESLRACMSEAQASFGDGRVFIEKLIVAPRHIEIQVLADSHGNVIYLGERECSIQRRHQKVIEEAPSPFLDVETRRRMGEAAVALAKAANYVSAGTVEFIVDADRNFYFLEMNTRLQVEHPVTEEVTGLDLVEQMIRIAAGEKLSIRQEDVTLNGWAMEARLYAEDPTRGFLPSIGRLARYREPVTGAFGTSKTIRIDSGANEGDHITRHYDPMIAKLIAVGDTRDQAVQQMQSALDEFYVRGVGNNLGFVAAIIAHPEFRAGNLTTDFIAKYFGARFDPTQGTEAVSSTFAAVAGAIHWRLQKRNTEIAAWTMDGQPVPRTGVTLAKDWVAIVNGQPHRLSLGETNGTVEISVDGRNRQVVSNWSPTSYLFKGTVDGEGVCIQVDRVATGYRLSQGGVFADIQVVSPRAAELIASMPERELGLSGKEVKSPMPGLIVSIGVEVGQQVEAGDPLGVIEAMKMENQLLAERSGKIAKILCAAGDSVEVDQVILEFE